MESHLSTTPILPPKATFPNAGVCRHFQADPADAEVNADDDVFGSKFEGKQCHQGFGLQYCTHICRYTNVLNQHPFKHLLTNIKWIARL